MVKYHNILSLVGYISFLDQQQWEEPFNSKLIIYEMFRHHYKNATLKMYQKMIKVQIRVWFIIFILFVFWYKPIWECKSCLNPFLSPTSTKQWGYDSLAQGNMQL